MKILLKGSILLVIIFSSIQLAHAQCPTGEVEIDVEIFSTFRSYSVYWELENSNGTVVASGGNPLAYPGGQGVTSVSDPLAYPEDILITETVCVPNSDTYTLKAYNDGTWGADYVIRYNGIKLARLGHFSYRGDVTPLEFSLPVPTLDAALVDLLPGGSGTMRKGKYHVETWIKNTGQTAITSLDIDWTVDGITRTEEVTGINIEPGEKIKHIHALGWWANTAGNYDLSVTISNINGTTDDDANNNEIAYNVDVVSVTDTKIALIEQFSSMSCNPCALYEPALFDWYYDNSTEAVMIEYQSGLGVNYLYDDNPTEADDRAVYYSNFSLPETILNGTSFQDNTGDITAADLNDAASESSSLKFQNVEAYLSNDSIICSATMQYLTTDPSLTLHMVVVEKRVQYDMPVGSNRDSEFGWVMRKMLPTSSGTALPVFGLTGTPQTVNGAWKIANYVKNPDQLGVVFFVQDELTKTVIQAKKAMVYGKPDVTVPDTTTVDTTVAVVELSDGNSLSFYPNPANDFVNLEVNLQNTQELNIKLVDLSGRQVKNMAYSRVTSGVSNLLIDVADMPIGTYLLVVDDGKTLSSDKILISR